jgi:hypothetical protein
MRKWMTRWSRSITWTLAVALAVAVSANCATGEEMTDAQKACCAAMGHACGSMAQSEDCCSHEGSRVSQALITAKGISLAAPSLFALPVTVVPALPPAPRRADFAQIAHVPLEPSRVPKYILIATFLI